MQMGGAAKIRKILVPPAPPVYRKYPKVIQYTKHIMIIAICIKALRFLRPNLHMIKSERAIEEVRVQNSASFETATLPWV